MGLVENDVLRKDPERVRFGRLGALTVHARGRTNTAPARAAWEAKRLAEIDPEGVLSGAERERRFSYAMRARMTRLAMARWGSKKAGAANLASPARGPDGAASRPGVAVS